MKITRFALPAAAVCAVVVIVFAAGDDAPQEVRQARSDPESFNNVVQQIDTKLQDRTAEADAPVARPSAELAVLRRLSLALHGTIPSLEEIRRFQSDRREDRLTHWSRQMLDDPRFGDYFGERMARVLVGTENGPFIVFRRDRFTEWLSEQLQQDRPYDEVVREMLSQTGLWTGRPATNFVTVAIIDNNADENKLAGRAVRAFLGQRIDCAQCHDHPFGEWTQNQFEGLAAYFGGVTLSPFGLEDKSRDYRIQDRETLQERTVKPSVPFGQQWLPDEGKPREQLAAWVTHEENRRFGRATANRVWGLLFGKPWSSPVDDLPDPPAEPDLLDLLGEDFRRHNCSIKRLIEVITTTSAFRASSTVDRESDSPVAAEAWSVFPLVRLRPEQVIGSVLQSASLKTIDRNSHLIVRAIRLVREGDFVREYGDLGDSELDSRTGTIPQRLIMMNGNLIHELTEANLFSAAGRIAAMAPTDDACVETAFLVCLSRKPSAAEQQHFTAQLHGTKEDRRRKVVEDLFWSLINSTEFSWNH